MNDAYIYLCVINHQLITLVKEYHNRIYDLDSLIDLDHGVNTDDIKKLFEFSDHAMKKIESIYPEDTRPDYLVNEELPIKKNK